MNQIQLNILSPWRDDPKLDPPRNSPLFLQAVEAIVAHHQLNGDLTFCSDGTQVVYLVGKEYAIKLFPDKYREDYLAEKTYLSHLGKSLTIPIPKIQAHGEVDQWPYLVMSQIPGQPWNQVKEQISWENQKRLCQQLGKITSELHKISAEGLPQPAMGWPSYLQKQREQVSQTQIKRGLPVEWGPRIDSFLAQTSLPPEEKLVSVPLHTELMQQHVMVEKIDQQWEITGLIDFESSWAGPWQYEMPSVGLFVCRGDGALFRAFLEAYGLPHSELNANFSRKMLAWTLCHKYCHLPWYFKELPPPKDASTLDELARTWFSLNN